MSIEQVIKYVLHTPYNTNRAVLASILEQLIISYGGDPTVDPDGPTPGKDVVYDGGLEQ